VQVLATPLLGRGSRGQDVVHLQAALARVGCFDRDIDGIFGADTCAALRKFQQIKGLPGSDSLAETEARLLGWTAWQPNLEACPPALRTATSSLFALAARQNIAANLSSVWTALNALQLSDPAMLAVVMATIKVESSLFLPVSELPSTFNTTQGGKPFDRYDDRTTLGNRGAPDGSLFRGRGFIQLTGRANYVEMTRMCNLATSLEQDPFQAHHSDVSARILAAFLKRREARIRRALAQNDLTDIRKAVNGGTNGLEEFVTAFKAAQQLFTAATVTIQR
jgi:putative chitinase